MYAKRVISALILNKYKKTKNNTQPQPKTLDTCNICVEDTTCIKICSCTACICMPCLERKKSQSVFDMPIGYRGISTLTKQ